MNVLRVNIISYRKICYGRQGTLRELSEVFGFVGCIETGWDETRNVKRRLYSCKCIA